VNMLWKTLDQSSPYHPPMPALNITESKRGILTSTSDSKSSSLLRLLTVPDRSWSAARRMAGRLQRSSWTLRMWTRRVVCFGS
jgi:hypothetical protein